MEKTFTISEKYNSFLWLPAKTASSTLSWIFAFFDFGIYREKNGNLELFRENSIHFGHETNFPVNNENMTFILSTSNPYDRVFSLFKMGNMERRDKLSKDDFDNFLEKQIFKNSNLTWSISSLLDIRKPDFIIEKNNLFNDLIKIPFIEDSRLYNSGILREMCEKKVNSSFEIEYKEKFLNQQNKDLIYNFFKSDFDYFGYSK